MGGISVLFLMGLLSIVFWIFIAIFLVMIIYLIITYIFDGLTITTISKNLNYSPVATSWIPFYNKFLLGKAAGSKVLGIIISILNAITAVTGVYYYIRSEMSPLPFVIFLICVLIGFVIDIIIAHKLYKNAIGKYGDILTVFSILSLGLLRPIFLFAIRNKITKPLDVEVK